LRENIDFNVKFGNIEFPSISSYDKRLIIVAFTKLEIKEGFGSVKTIKSHAIWV